MYLKALEISGFKSFGKKVRLDFNCPISSIVGPNGSGKSNIAESFRFVLGEQSIKSMRGKKGEDLIFNGTNTVTKQNRASVKVFFDNSDKMLPVDFDEVTIERVVNRDGSNEYSINNSPVRLKDISELLASANIGSSGHHIISQGEADRILNTSIKERREMLEDALGLRLFQFKKVESEKKLVKTEENIKQIESLRREIAPHIKFLKKQVEKIEEAKELKLKLIGSYKRYLKRESVYLNNKKVVLAEALDTPRKKLVEIEKEISELNQKTESGERNFLIEEIKKSENDLSSISTRRNDLIRQIGRIEGEVDSLKRVFEKQKVHQSDEIISVSKSELESLKNDINNNNLLSLDLDAIKGLIQKILARVNEFIDEKVKKDEAQFSIDEDLKVLNEKKENFNVEINELLKQEDELRGILKIQREKLDSDKNDSIEAERKIISLMREKNEWQNKVSEYAIQSDILERDEHSFKQELTEAAVLVGREVLNYEGEETDDIASEERQIQLNFKREIERMKIKVEEMGASGGDEVVKEYAETIERDEFLIKEIADLENSSENLRQLILELDEQINTRFKEGINKVNTEFQKFFELMFGGGNASLQVVKIKKNKKSDTDLMLGEDEGDEIKEEETDEQEGIDISVNLPRKKVKGLMMLSGGERALTSIALLFAISQVNPPPFIILDETDAALDEANSRKYADMIVSLSKYSQLILITHNRETMSRAGILYGVTMTQGVSQLLSIAFDEGVQWAK